VLTKPTYLKGIRIIGEFFIFFDKRATHWAFYPTIFQTNESKSSSSSSNKDKGSGGRFGIGEFFIAVQA